MIELTNISHANQVSEQIRRDAELHRMQVQNQLAKEEATADDPTVVIRAARPEDGPALRRLAQVDSANRLHPGSVLVAEVDGELLAALSIDSGHSVANPFRHTSELVEMLVERASQLRGEQARRDGRLRRTWNALRGRATRPAMAPVSGDVSMPIRHDGE